MHWKLKSQLQNAVSALPSSVSYAVYYWLQRNFSELKRINPTGWLEAGVATIEKINSLGKDVRDRTFFEVGTGRVPLLPLAYWLAGARNIITMDLNPYLKEELVVESLECIKGHCSEVRALFGPLLDETRFSNLLDFHDNGRFSIDAFLDLCRIQYIAPGSAAETGLQAGAIDFHTSRSVLEHIPPDTLTAILKEGNRIVGKGGLFVHRIDYSDHFSHSDRNISAINFLQYSESEWRRYAGNRYMYMNRMRHDDFVDLFKSAGHRLLLNDPHRDARSLALLKSGEIKPTGRFSKKSDGTNAVRNAWIISEYGGRLA